jgi:hypothetical protein
MTETEWLTCEDPYTMLDSGPVNAGERKLQLFAVACCRRFRLPNPSLTISMAITAAEQLADGEGSLNELQDLGSAAQTMGDPGRAPSEPAARIARAVCMLPRNQDDVYLDQIQDIVRETCHDHEDKSPAANLLRDIFGNPFRPAAVSSEWRTSTAIALAKHIYEARDFAQMPILADALQDAGCDNADILNHCRDANGVHVRGCWVVDLVLGKE